MEGKEWKNTLNKTFFPPANETKNEKDNGQAPLCLLMGDLKKKVLLKTDRQVKDLKKSTPPYLIQVKNVQNFNLGLVIVDRL